MPNVVNADGVAQQLQINGDKPFYIPTDFMADSLSFTKSGDGYQALRLPFDTQAGLGFVDVIPADQLPDGLVPAGLPVLFQGNVNITESERRVNAGTFAETESGYIYDGTSFVYAENISPFTYVWDDPNSIETIENGQLKMDNAAIYNLAGQRVSKPTKGIYIIGGKKILK